MSDLRRQHEEHAKVVIGKEILAEELERCRNALQKQDREFEQLKRCHENERSTLIESKRTCVVVQRGVCAYVCVCRGKRARAGKKDKGHDRTTVWQCNRQQEELARLRAQLRRSNADKEQLKADSERQIGRSHSSLLNTVSFSKIHKDKSWKRKQIFGTRFCSSRRS